MNDKNLSFQTVDKIQVSSLFLNEKYIIVDIDTVIKDYQISIMVLKS